MMRWMPFIETWMLEGTFPERLCLTLAHSLWQFGLVAVLVALLEQIGRRLSHTARYNLALALFGMGLLAVPVTWLTISTAVNPPISLRSTSQTDRELPANEVMRSSLVSRGEHEQPAPLVSAPATAGVPVSSTVKAQTPPRVGWGGEGWSNGARWIAVCYMVGVCLMSWRLVRGLWFNQRLARVSRSLIDHPLCAALESLAARWKLRVLPRLAVAGEVAMPCVIGLVRPTILFPLAALNSLSPRELEMILAHELAHIRRRDLWVHLAQRLAEALLFFNPGMWYVSRRISLLREYCCDAVASERAVPETAFADELAARVAYAKALVHLAEVQLVHENLRGAEQLASLAAAGGSPTQLRRRIGILLGEPHRAPLRVARPVLLILALLVTALLFSPAFVVSNDQSSPSKPLLINPKLSPSEASSSSDRRFIKRHSSGVEVKLLAIGTRGEPVQRWWRPDGTRLDGEPYHVKDFDRYSFPGPLTREVVFSMENVPQGVHWVFRTQPKSNSTGAGGVTDAQGNRLRYHHAHIASLPADTRVFGLEVGLSTGEWETVASYDVQRGGRVRADHGVIFGGPFDSGPFHNEMTVSHEFIGQVRLVTFGKHRYQGPEIEGYRESAGDRLFVSHFQFRQPIENVERVEFQTRPYEWIAFDDLPAQPRREDANSKSEVTPAVKVLAIGYGDAVPAENQRWWNADGSPCESPQSMFNGRRNPRMLSDPRARQIIWELPEYRAGTAVRYEVSSKNGQSRGELSVAELGVAEGRAKIMHELHTIDPAAQTFALKVGVANGTWKTVFSGEAGAVAQGNSELKGVVFSDAFAHGVGSAVVVSHNWHGQKARLVAIDKSGKRHTGKFSSQLTAVETVNQTIFEFNGLKPADIASYDFQVQDFAWTTIDNLPANPKPAADAKATISGRIKLADGSPATSEGELQYRHIGKDGKQVMGTAGNFKGQYTFEVPAGTVWLAYFTKEFAAVVAGPFELEPGEQLKYIDFLLRPGVTGYLKFENEEREPVPAQVMAVPYLGDSSGGPSVAHEADEEGNLRIENLAESIAYRLSIHAAGYQPTTTTLSFDAPEAGWPVAPTTMKLRKARPATGRVLRSNGEPASDAMLKMRGGINGPDVVSSPEPKEVQVSDDGRYSIDQLVDGGYYLVMVEAADGGRVMLPPVIAGQSDLEVKIPPRRDLKVRIIGDLEKLDKRKNQPVIRIGQRYLMKTPSGKSYGDYLGETVELRVTDDGGTAVYRGLIDAPIVINVGKREYEFDAAETEVTIRLGDALDQNRY